MVALWNRGMDRLAAPVDPQKFPVKDLGSNPMDSYSPHDLDTTLHFYLR